LAWASVQLHYLYGGQHFGFEAHQPAHIGQGGVPARGEMPALPAVDRLVLGRG